MKKLISLFLCAVMMLAVLFLGVSAADTTVIYVNDGGAGDGKTEATAMGDIEAAYLEAATADGDAEIVIVDTYTAVFSPNLIAPEHANKITIRGKTPESKLAVTATIWLCGGDTEFKDITFDCPSEMKITSNLYNLTMNTGITMANAKVSVRGTDTVGEHGMEGLGYVGDDYKIVVLSGTYNDVVGFGHNGCKGNFDGNVTIYFGGTAYARQLVLCRNAKYTVNNATLIVDGGHVDRFISSCDRPWMDLSNLAYESGVTETFTMILTDKYNIADSFVEAHSGSIFCGISGTTCGFGAESLYDDGLGLKHILKIEAGIYDAIVADAGDRMNEKSFDEIVKIDTGSGVPADLLPSAAPATPAVTDAPVVTTEALAADTTAAPAVTDKPADQAPATGSATVAVLFVAVASASAASIVIAKKSKEN